MNCGNWSVVLLDDYYRFNEFVGNPQLVRMLHGSNRILLMFANTVHEQFVCSASSFPSLVAVHGVIAANNCGNCAAADVCHLSLQRTDVSCRRRWRRVSAIEKAVNKDLLEPVVFRHLQKGIQVC